MRLKYCKLTGDTKEVVDLIGDFHIGIPKTSLLLSLLFYTTALVDSSAEGIPDKQPAVRQSRVKVAR